MATATKKAERRDGIPDSKLTDEDRLGIYEHMVLMRKVEEKGISLYKQGKIPDPSTTVVARRRSASARSGHSTGPMPSARR